MNINGHDVIHHPKTGKVTLFGYCQDTERAARLYMDTDLARRLADDLREAADRDTACYTGGQRSPQEGDEPNEPS